MDAKNRIRKARVCLAALGLFVGLLTNNEMKVNASGYEYKSVLDISNMRLIPTGVTMQSCIEGAKAPSVRQWRYGPVYDSTGERTVTLASQYCFDKLTGTAAEWYDNDNAGNVVFNGTDDKIANNTEYIIRFEEKTGYHTAAYTPPAGTQIPLAGWENKGKTLATHHEGFDVRKYPVGGNKGLIDPEHYGTWARYDGIEFHAVPVDKDKFVAIAPNEVQSPCYDKENSHPAKDEDGNYIYQTDDDGNYILDENGQRKLLINYVFYRNSTTWFPVCAVCGEYVAEYRHYAPIEAVKSLPVLEQGQEVVCTCPTCGGMETSFTYNHTCKILSANRFFVTYDVGTDDPATYGATNDSVWYYNFASEYEGVAVEQQDRKVAECGFVRPGYTFAGWSLSKGGSVAYNAGASLLAVQNSMVSLKNNEVVKLYAVWTPNVSYLKIDANSGSFGGGGAYNGQAVWTYGPVPFQIQNSADGNDKGKTAGFSTSTYTLNSSLVTYPNGYKVTYNTQGGSCGKSYEYAPVYLSEWKVVSANNNGVFFPNTNKYVFGAENRSTVNADTIKLYYRQGEVVLPSASKANTSFVGWYEDASFTRYVGTTGDFYNPSGNVTLYARFATLKVSVADVYFKNSSGTNYFGNILKDSNGKSLNIASGLTPYSETHVHNGVGAVNVSMGMYTGDIESNIYEVKYQKSGAYGTNPDNWPTLDNISTNVSNHHGTYATKGAPYIHSINSTGYYLLIAYGAQGGAYNGNTGGKGGKAFGTFYLKKGERLIMRVGGMADTATGGGQGSDGGNGGGYTAIYKEDTNGIRTLLLMAGGGSGATSTENGKPGGTEDKLRTDNVHEGANGTSGGGGGYVGGAAD